MRRRPQSPWPGTDIVQNLDVSTSFVETLFLSRRAPALASRPHGGSAPTCPASRSPGIVSSVGATASTLDICSYSW